jgi:hypothetical protein
MRTSSTPIAATRPTTSTDQRHVNHTRISAGMARKAIVRTRRRCARTRGSASRAGSAGPASMIAGNREQALQFAADERLRVA